MTEIIHFLEQQDTELFLYLNGIHTNFWDHFMMMYTHRFIWIPFYASFLFVMFKNFSWRVMITCILLIALIVTLCDQTASSLLKPMVGRMRPSNLDNPIAPLVHVVNGYRGGRFGFPSSHAANAWSMAFFAMYLVRRNKLTIFLMLWAFVMSYSRTYLGVHYPGDLLVGTIIGFFYATLSYYIFQRVKGDYTHLFKPVAGPLKYSSLPIITGIATVGLILITSGVMVILGI